MFNEKTFLGKIQECIGMSFKRYDGAKGIFAPYHPLIPSEYKKLQWYFGGYDQEYRVGILITNDDKSIIIIYRNTGDKVKPITDEEFDKVCFMLHFVVHEEIDTTNNRHFRMRYGKGI